VALAHQEDRYRPKKNPYHSNSKRIRAIHQEEHQLTMAMQLDMESLLIYLNLTLDQYAAVFGHLQELSSVDRWRFPFNDLFASVERPSQQPAIQFLQNNYCTHLVWLYYKVRRYRNRFVEHLDRPIQRGTIRPIYQEGFTLFAPATHGSMDAAEEAQHYQSLAQIAARQTWLSAAQDLLSRPRRGQCRHRYRTPNRPTPNQPTATAR
jgi:hypothetical protein